MDALCKQKEQEHRLPKQMSSLAREPTVPRARQCDISQTTLKTLTLVASEREEGQGTVGQVYLLIHHSLWIHGCLQTYYYIAKMSVLVPLPRKSSLS